MKKDADQKKFCTKCSQEKSIDCFNQYKSGKNKGYYYSYCKNCQTIYLKEHRKRNLYVREKYIQYNKEYRKINPWGEKDTQLRKEYLKRNPWRGVYSRIKTRCEYDKTNKYYIKGIKVQITILELKDLWFRDKAFLLKRPSIDRIDSKGNYTKDNCRFIELSENSRRKGVCLNDK